MTALKFLVVARWRQCLSAEPPSVCQSASNVLFKYIRHLSFTASDIKSININSFSEGAQKFPTKVEGKTESGEKRFEMTKEAQCHERKSDLKKEL